MLNSWTPPSPERKRRIRPGSSPSYNVSILISKLTVCDWLTLSGRRRRPSYRRMTPEKLQTIMEEYRLKSGLTPKTPIQTPVMMRETPISSRSSPAPIITPPVFASPAPEPMSGFAVPSTRSFSSATQMRTNQYHRSPGRNMAFKPRAKANLDFIDRPWAIDFISVLLCCTHIVPVLYIGCDDLYTNSMIIITMALQVITTTLKPYDLLLDTRLV